MECTKITRFDCRPITNNYCFQPSIIVAAIFEGILFVYVCNMVEIKQENVSETALVEALVQLQSGKYVVLQTNHYYTVVCDATHQEAVNVLIAKAKQCQMRVIVMMASEREILHHTASFDLAIFDALAELETRSMLPIAILCNGALNLAAGVENPLGQFLLHKTSDELAKQLIKRLRNPICCLQASASSNLAPLKNVFPSTTAYTLTQKTFFTAQVYEPLCSGLLQLLDT